VPMCRVLLCCFVWLVEMSSAGRRSLNKNATATREKKETTAAVYVITVPDT
jgi:hypothetical protein